MNVTRYPYYSLRKSQHSSGIPSCAFVNSHVKMGLS